MMMQKTGFWLLALAAIALFGVVLWYATRFTPHRYDASYTASGQAVRVAGGPARAAAAAARVKPLLEPRLAALGLAWGDPVFLRAYKEEGVLELWMQPQSTGRFVLFESYRIAAQSGDLGPKQKEGDGQVPEGFYQVGREAMKPDSSYHLAFNIGYPNAYDRAWDRTGSFIMIHGAEASIGCLAMTDEKIEEIYSLCDAALLAGQKRFAVHMFPFRMIAERLQRENSSQHYEFWKNLSEGHRLFEEQGQPPAVSVEKKRYHFAPGP